MTKKLTRFEQYITQQGGTERPETGLWTNKETSGTYHCKVCDAPLFRSEHKFSSHCGWPSFDDEISGAVKRLTDKDGSRVEIRCANCEAHLGHVFTGEGFTTKNLRHCVNSVSMTFKPSTEVKTKTALFASGCFWGTEYFLARVPGVVSTKVGYAGGTKEHPTYKEVCRGDTGHLECVEVTYEADKVSYEDLAKIFFETHDFTQANGQGPDIGSPYLSTAFYNDASEEQILQSLIEELERRGFRVATKILPANKFWPAEEEHQLYYERQGEQPYCHRYRKLF